MGLEIDAHRQGTRLRAASADPIPFDAEYTRDLGYGAVKFLLSDESAQYGAVISLVGGRLKPLPLRGHDQPGNAAA